MLYNCIIRECFQWIRKVPWFV